eukprot:1177185-Prorocentrum_minimum.AAC.6
MTTGCPDGSFEVAQCTARGLLTEDEFCCPDNTPVLTPQERTCSTEGTGCRFERGFFTVRVLGFRLPLNSLKLPLNSLELPLISLNLPLNSLVFFCIRAAASCPNGFVEVEQCTERGFVTDDEFCCPATPPPAGSPTPVEESPATTPTRQFLADNRCSTDGTGCVFETDFFVSQCRTGYFERTQCTRSGTFFDDEFCCPT